MLLPGFAFCQVSDFHFETEQSNSLKPVLEILSAQYGLEFAYDNILLDTRFPPSSIRFSGTLEGFLAKVFEPVDILFSLSSNTKVLLRSAYESDDLSSLEHSIFKGRIFNQSGETLPYVSISVPTTNLNILSGEDGSYELVMSPLEKDADVHFLFLGYEPKIISLETLEAHPDVILKSASYQLQEITILTTPQKFMPRVTDHGLEIDGNLLKTLMASGLSGADLFRNIQLLPGVAAFEDNDTSIKIRGGKSDETLIILDGIPIFRADHYFGIFSAINTGFVNEINLYRNSMPIEFGGKTSGLLLMGSENSSDVLSADLEVNLLNTSADLQIPLGHKVNLLLSGRSSYRNVNQSLLSATAEAQPVIDIDDAGQSRSLTRSLPEFRFHDINSRLVFSPSKGTELDASFFYSFDDFANRFNAIYRVNSEVRPSISRTEYAHFSQWENLGGAFNFKHQLDQNWHLSGNAHVSSYNVDESITSSILRITPVDSTFLSFNNFQFNEIIQSGGRFLATHENLNNNQLKIGASATFLSADVRFNEDDSTFFQRSDNASDLRLFGSYRALINDKISLEAGSRVIYYEGSRKPYFSPQLLLGYLVNSNTSLKASVSRNYQFTRALYLENRLGQNREFVVLANGENIPVGHSTNFMVGGSITEKVVSLDFEAYHKILHGVLEVALLNNGFDDNFSGPSTNSNYRLFSGTGTSTGMDILLAVEKGEYTGWLSYTISKTSHRFPQIQSNTPFAAQNDRRHQLKLVNKMSFGNFDISGNYVFSSGRPYTDISSLLPLVDRRELQADDRQNRLPNYHRLDLGIQYGFSMGKIKSSIGVSVYNLTGRQNVNYFQFLYNLPETENSSSTLRSNTVVGTEAEMLPRTLNLSFKLSY